MADIDLVEINEAFAPSSWRGSGRPVLRAGATGGRFGLQTMCEGGGQVNVTILERLG
jgi:acetyl-CoA acetyltransferase